MYRFCLVSFAVSLSWVFVHGSAKAEGCFDYEFPVLAANVPVGAAPVEMAIVDDDLFYHDGDRLYIVDIEDPSEPVPLGDVACFEPDRSTLEVSGDLVVYVSGWAAAALVDISDPTEPVMASWVAPTCCWLGDTTVQGDYLYAVTDSLRIWDVSDPYQPIRLPSVAESGAWVESDSEYLYVVTGVSLRTFSLADPAVPGFVAEVMFESPLDLWAQWPVLDGEYLHMTSESESGHQFVTFDVSNPATPVPLSTADYRGGLYFDVSGARMATDEFLYDVTHPEAPRQVMEWPSEPWRLAVSKDVAAVYLDSGIDVFSFQLGGVSAGLPILSRSVDVQGGTIAVASDSALVLAELDGPSEIKVVSSFVVDGTPVAVVIGSGVAFLTTQEPAQLVAFDVSDPTLPILLETFPVSGGFMRLTLEGNTLVTSRFDGEVRVYDVATLPGIAELSSFYVGESVRDIRLEGGKLALVADEALRIVDLTDPKDPALGPWLDIGYTLSAVDVDEGHAFVGSSWGLHVASITELGSPVLVGELRDISHRHVSVHEGVLAFASHDGVGLTDVSDPAQPSPITRLSLPDQWDAVVGTAFLSAGETLSVIPVPCSTPSNANAISAFAWSSGLSASPNPFRDGTLLEFREPLTADAKIRVFDCTGRLVRALRVRRNESHVWWDGLDGSGRAVANGVYLASLKTGGEWQSRRLTIVR